MTHLCVAIFVTDLAQAKRDAALAAEAGADMVELRIDPFVRDEHLDGLLAGGHVEAQLKELLHAIPVPCIVTCRPTWEGGHSTLDDGERTAILRSVGCERANYVDIELAAHRTPAAQELASRPRDERCGIIFSAHDFAGRPARLYNVVTDLNDAPCDVAKLVWTAKTVRDNVEAFELLLHRQKPTIALCMGEAGLISRVLARKFNAFLTFASLEAGSGTAPGQVSVADMKRLYRWDAIGADTKVYGVVGHPVAHSMSPAIHNAAFEAVGHDGVYLPLLVEPGYESFKAFMETFLGFEPLGLSGLSVTIPHKENALRYLIEKGAEVDPLARSIGALNTIVVDRGGRQAAPRLRGFSTDYAAILDSITAKLGIDRSGLSGLRVAVLGAGGTGRTAVAALAHYGATVVVYNRTRERAEELAAEFDGKTGKVVAAPLEKLCDSCCQVYLNATSVGMHPNVQASPFGEAPPKLGTETLVFDSVYNPMRTRLIEQAEAAGAKTVGGVEMFVRQAVGQFEAWTGRSAPADLMRQVVERRLMAR